MGAGGVCVVELPLGILSLTDVIARSMNARYRDVYTDMQPTVRVLREI